MSHRSDRHGRAWMGATAVSPVESSTSVPFLVLEVATTTLDGGPVRTLTAVAGAWVDESSPATNLGTDSILKVRSPGLIGDPRDLLRFPAPEAVAASTTSGVGWREWAVTQQAMNDGANHGFLRDALSGCSGEQRFYSRKARTNRPQRVVTFAAID